MKLKTWKKMIKSDDAGDRSDAAEELPDAPDEEIVPDLINCLDDTDYMVRICAAESLGLFPTDEVKAALKRMVERETHDLPRSYALYSLGEIASVDDLGPLLESLKSDASPRARFYAARGILCFATRMVEQQIFSLLEGDDEDLVATAASVIVYLQGERNLSRNDFEEALVKCAKREIGLKRTVEGHLTEIREMSEKRSE